MRKSFNEMVVKSVYSFTRFILFVIQGFGNLQLQPLIVSAADKWNPRKSTLSLPITHLDAFNEIPANFRRSNTAFKANLCSSKVRLKQ